MENQKKRCGIPFADLPIWMKFAVTVLLLAVAVLLLVIAMMPTISVTQKEKYQQMEQTAITSAEQVMNLSIETAVSIAKSIYTNDAIYEFLNTRYESASAYYETYYPIKQNSAMNLADTNIVKECLIYTANPTVLVGGSIRKLEDAKDESWYQSFQQMGKPTILCLDPDTSMLVLVRKLDYRSLDTGDSYLYLELDSNILPSFMEQLGFDGEMYVLSGSKLLYTNREDVQTAENVNISADYACLTRNYYTIPIEFYSRAARHGFIGFLADNRYLLIALGITAALLVFTSYFLFYGIRRRISPLLKDFRENGTIHLPEAGTSGKDEIGQLLDAAIVCADNLRHEDSEHPMNNDMIHRATAEYDKLFRTAMRLDAELVMQEHFPNLKRPGPALNIPLAQELAMLEKIASQLHARFQSDEIPLEGWTVPAYTIVLIGEDIFRRFIDPSVTITVDGTAAHITFESPVKPKSTDSLKFRAIFEDSNISEVYDFDRSYRFNPYLRLKACQGSGVDIELNDKIHFKFVIILTQQGGTV